MLIGYTFDEQLFTSEAFAKFQNTFLNGKEGVIDGCSLLNTTTNMTINSGWFVIQGRLLREQGGATLSPNGDGYYKTVCEIDLTKENTETSLLQATFKLISNASVYPTLTQQDINDGGTLYQYEFARFRVVSGSITEFVDKRTTLNFEDLYQAILDKLSELEEQSNILFKTGGTINGDLEVTGNIYGDISGTARKCQ